MLPLAAKVYTVTPPGPRGLPAEALCAEARKYHGDVQCAASVKEALLRALQDAGQMTGDGQLDKPMILAFGSLSYLGELKSEFARM